MADVADEKKVTEVAAPAKENVEPVADEKDSSADDSEKSTEKDAEDTKAAADEKEEDSDAKADVDAAADGDAEADTVAKGEKNGDGNGGDWITRLERKIIRQVEYYFGDANLNRDKFLLEQISKEEEGWVPLSVLLTFKRLAELSSDAAVIAEAVRKSDEGLVEVSDDREKVRRHPERPIPEHNEERRKEVMSRTAYAKGFPLETDMSELIDFFAPYEKVANISMRKYLDKPTKTYKFKGSVFVTFEKKEQTQEFIEKEKVLFKERELVRKWQDKYLEDKREEMKAKSKKPKAKPAEESKFQLPKGTVVFFEGANEEVSRELVREALENVKSGAYEIAYIDFSKGDKDGHIRFQEENIAVKFLEELKDKKLKLRGDMELTLRTLSEEEEKAFLDKAIEHMKSRRNQHNKHKGGGHGHGHGNRKRRGNDNRNDDKRKKAEAQ